MQKNTSIGVFKSQFDSVLKNIDYEKAYISQVFSKIKIYPDTPARAPTV